MSDNFHINSIQNRIGYDFKDTELLRLALTHVSSANDAENSNQGLSFLGRAVLELLVRDHLYSNYSYASIETLENTGTEETAAFSLACKCGEQLRLSEFVIISNAATAIKNSPAVEKELFLALSAAIYKDGGMPAIRAFIIPKLRAVISSEAPHLAHRAVRRASPSASSDASQDKRDASASVSASRTAAKATDAIKSLITSKLRRPWQTSDATDTANAKPTDKKASTAARKDASKTSTAETSPRKRTGARTSEKDTSSAFETPFIRDALTPVKLSEKQQNELVKKTKKSKPEVKTVNASAQTETDDAANYKSALQEYVQKNVHSSTVMLEYRTEKAEGGAVSVEVYLFDRKLSSETGASKKDASRFAARSAYRALTDEKSKEAAWFRGICSDPTHLPLPQGSEQNDHVSQLNQTFQKLGHTSNAQLLYERIPASNKKLFAVTVNANGKELGRGEGKTVKEARQNAAKAALASLPKLTLV